MSKALITQFVHCSLTVRENELAWLAAVVWIENSSHPPIRTSLLCAEAEKHPPSGLNFKLHALLFVMCEGLNYTELYYITLQDSLQSRM